MDRRSSVGRRGFPLVSPMSMEASSEYGDV